MTDYFSVKLAALSTHRAQAAHLDDLEGMIRTHLARTAERHGFPAGRLAEVFQIVDTA